MLPIKKSRLNDHRTETRNKLRWVVGGIALAYGFIVFTLSTAWYSGQMIEPFHFFDDLPEWKQLDKFSHFFITFQAATLSYRLFSWAELKSALKWGAVAGFFFVSSIEIPDGFSTGYGASIFDLIANALGATFFFLQMKFWKSIKIIPKFSFHPTLYAIQRPSLLGDGFLQEMIKDYNGQTFWYSWSPEKKGWPSFLSIAIGVGAEGMIYGRDAQNELHDFSPYRKFFFSLDLNPQYFQSKQKWVQVMIYPLTIFKCPAPAIEFSSQGVRWHWLYF